jgi:uncharacterized protein DUF5132
MVCQNPRNYCVGDSVKEVVAEAGEQLSDLVAEVRAERTSNGTTTAGTTEPDGGHSRIITPS